MFELNDEMDDSVVHPQAAIILDHPLYSRLVKGVVGDLTEVDGDFTIELTNDEKIVYHYRFSPHVSMERPGDKEFYYVPYDSNVRVHMNFDYFLEEYGSAMGMIVGALTMYVDHKLGI